jgi:lipoate---protein ligase
MEKEKIDLNQEASLISKVPEGALFEHYNWEIIDTGIRSAEENMRFDAQLLEKAETFSRPVLHFYEWATPSATHGYFTHPSELLSLENVQKLSLNLARRPTGGGIVFHIWDMAFSVLVSAHCPEFSRNTLENYAFVNAAVLASIKEFLNPEGGLSTPLSLTPDDFTPWDPNCSHFCMAKPTKYDVMWKGRKVAGAAQRKTRNGFLHQGTIALVMPPIDYLEQLLLPGTKVKEAMLAHTWPLLGGLASSAEITHAKQCLRKLLSTHLSRSSLRLRT